MSPVAYTWGPFSAKIFLKIWFCKIDPLLPPHIDFNTIPYFTYGCPYRGVKEGKLKSGGNPPPKKPEKKKKKAPGGNILPYVEDLESTDVDEGSIGL